MTELVYQINKADDPALFKKRRAHAKCIYLGVTYGEGGAKLCNDLGLPTRWALRSGRGQPLRYFEHHEEALRARAEQNGEGFLWLAAGAEGQAILDEFDKRAPFIKLLAKKAQKIVGARGHIITGGGRHLHFPQREDGSYDWTHKSLNRLIQGTSADQMKKAMVEIDRAGYWMMLQVHDETDNSVETPRQATEIADIMRETMPARVPFKVDVETGPSWGELEKIAA